MSSNYFKEIYYYPSRNLNNVTRYSGIYCMKNETDGYHVIDMMGMCLFICEKLRVKDVKVDPKDVIYRCYIHDLDEVLAGDIQRNIKYYNEEIYNSISWVVTDLMYKNYSRELIDDISHSKDIDTIEGMIVKVADTLQSSLKIYEEVKLNNFHFNKVLKEHLGFLDSLMSKITSLEDNCDDEDSDRVRTICFLTELIRDFKGELLELYNSTTY